MDKFLPTFLLLLSFHLEAKLMKPIQIDPGKSLGEVSVGQTSSSLLKAGFVADKVRIEIPGSLSYLTKDQLLVRLEDDRVVQIWFVGKDLSTLRYEGKSLPKATEPKAFAEFFKTCEPVVQGSGGKLLYCADRGVELSFPGPTGPVGFSVILPAEVEKIIGTKPSKDGNN